ncbi:ABC-2 family transporter protein [bacterium]|nr:ABC-2 family transporter protein [bacterium]
MGKYRKIIYNVIQETSAYRLNHLISFLCVAIPLLAIIFLWRTVYQSIPSIKGYNEAMMITYYILSTWLGDLTGVVLWWEITSDIRDGNLSNYLLRPLSYQLYFFSTRLGANIPYSLIGAGITIIFIIFLAPDFYIPSNPLTIPLFLISLLLAMLLALQFTYLFSLSAFWLEESSSVNLFVDIFIPLMAGNLLPLDLFPTFISRLFKALPFNYLLYFPIDIYLERLPFSSIFRGFLVEMVWIAFLQLLIAVVWRRGIRRYTAVGG